MNISMAKVLILAAATGVLLFTGLSGPGIAEDNENIEPGRDHGYGRAQPDAARGPSTGPSKTGRTGRFGPMMARHRERFSEFVEWLTENYPEQAEKYVEWQLHGLHQGRPLPPGAGTYMRIFEAWKESPQLAEVLKEDLELKKQRGNLLRRMKRSRNENERQDLADQLKQVIGARFDLLVKRKQIEFEQLRTRLGELQKRVEQSAAEVARWNNDDFKNQNVDARLRELVSGPERFKWE
jgi:hypothetical protein